jgi:hypothetical protein
VRGPAIDDLGRGADAGPPGDLTELRGERVVLRALRRRRAGAPRDALDPRGGGLVGPLARDFRFGDDPDATRFTIMRDGEVAGLIQFGEEPEPD